MKRGITLIGRGGAILIAIGFAILLASFIPPAISSRSYGIQILLGKTWRPIYEALLTPQESLSISITTNNTINIYLLEVSFQTIYDWMKKVNPQIPEQKFLPNLDEKYLIEFLKANPYVTIIQKEVYHNEILEYTPTKIMNITLIIHNPNPSYIRANHEILTLVIKAPKIRAQNISQIVILLGFTLTIPWIINTIKDIRKIKS